MLLRAPGLLLLLAAVAPAQDLPHKVRLGRGAPGYAMHRYYALPEGVSAVAKPAARKARLEKSYFFFFDVDGNGKFNDRGVDGWALAKMPAMLPLEKKTVIGASEYTWRLEEDGSFIHFARKALPLGEGQKKTLIQFNQWRFMNGLPAVTIDQELSDACTKHCQYMDRHGMTHHEKEGLLGYTAAGAAAGVRACLGEDGPINSVHMFYATFYHRLPLIHPGTRSIGVGSTQRHTAVDGLTHREERPWIYPVIVPAPNSFGHPTRCAIEAPNPVPAAIERPGFPITLTFRSGTITAARAEMRLKNEKGRVVPIVVSSPEHPANPKRPRNRMTICIIPRVALAPMRTWWVRVTYELDGEPKRHVWRFNTGRPGPAPTLRPR